jgi:hypothetical protein
MMLYGCSTPSVKDEDLPPIPENLLAECLEPIALPNGRPKVLKDVLLLDSIDLLACRDKHKALVEVIRFRERVKNAHKE